MDEKKRKIAAMTAVLYYLQAEEESTRRTQAAARRTRPEPEGFWSFSSRQSQMMLRSMAQMRLFPGWRS